MKKFDKKIYDIFNDKFGILINVNDKKIPMGKWKDKTHSEKYKNKNMAIIPKKFENVNKFLVIIDVDTKKNGKGLDSLTKLEKDIGMSFSKTVISPSGGYHIYLVSEIEPEFKRYNKNYPDIEFVHSNSSKDGYILLPTNKGIKTKDSKGNDKIGDYKLLVDIDSIFTQESVNKSNFAIFKLNELLSENSKSNNKIDTNANENNEDFDSELLPEQLDSLLSYCDNEDYHNWIKYAGAYKKAGGILKGFIKWSLEANNAEEDISKLKTKWEVLPTDNLTVGTLYFEAYQNKLNQIKSIINNSSNLDKCTKEISSLVSTFPYISKNKYSKVIEDEIKNRYKKLNNSKSISSKKLAKYLEEIWNDEYYQNIVSDEYFDNKYDECLFKGNSSTYRDILSNKMKVNDEWLEHELSYNEQYNIIKDIFNRIKIIKDTSTRIIAFDKEFKTVLFIPLANNQFSLFKRAMIKQFPEIVSKDRSKEYINLSKIRDILLLQHETDYKEFYSVESILYKNIYNLDDEGNVIKNTQSKYFKNILNNINNVKKCNKNIYNGVIEAFNKHYFNLIEPLSKYLLLSKFFNNNKGMDVMVLGNTNFGKGYFFSIFDELGVAKFSDVEDYTKNGGSINNAPIEDYKLSFFNIFDEKSLYSKKFYEISGNLRYRPLYKSVTSINVGAKVFLDADGKTLSFEAVDNQVTNRLNIFDFRSIQDKTILDLIASLEDKYNIDDDTIRNIILTHYHDLIIDTVSKYKNMQRYKLVQIRKELESELFANKAYVDKSNIKNVEDSINETIKNVLSNTEPLVNLVEKDSSVEANIHISKKKDKLIITNPTKIFKEILLAYNADLEYELKHKNVKSLVEQRRIKYCIYTSIRDINNKVKKGIIIDIKAIEDDMFDTFDDIRRLKQEWIVK